MRDDRGTLVINGLSLHKVHTLIVVIDCTQIHTYVCYILFPSSTPSLKMLMSSWTCWSMEIRTGHSTQLKPTQPPPDHMLCSKCISIIAHLIRHHELFCISMLLIVYVYCSPSALTFDDTYNTLKYADRAKQIKSQVKNLNYVHQHNIVHVNIFLSMLFYSPSLYHSVG